jgi:hypothetical protein
VLLVFRIEKKGGSCAKVTALAATVMALALTHYLAIGVIAAIFAYCLIRLKGTSRRATACAIIIGMSIVAVAWGPKFISFNHGPWVPELGKNITDRTPTRSTLSVPYRLTFQSNYHPFVEMDDGPGYTIIALAIMVYLIPVFRFRRHPYLLMWWLWVVGEIGVIAVTDIARHILLMYYARYVILAAPAIYAILACPLPTRFGQWAPPMVLFGALVSAVAYWQVGAALTPDLRVTANRVNQKVRPGDAVILMGNFYNVGALEPAFDYAGLSHYGVNWKTPIVFATARFDEAMQRRLRKFRRVWVVGVHPQDDMKNILPTWSAYDIHGPGIGNSLWQARPPS